MIQTKIHEAVLKNQDRICKWFGQIRPGLFLPIYSSFDIRDSGNKIVPVDANIFPAGFNNICHMDRDLAPQHFRRYLETVYGGTASRLALLTEEHTSNLNYWENVVVLKEAFEKAGYFVRVCVPSEFKDPVQVTSASGKVVEVHSAKRVGNVVKWDDFVPDVMISNNDFSQSHEEWAKGLDLPMNPPRNLGWFQRKKSDHFKFYNQLATEFAELLEIDPWIFTVDTEYVEGFDVNDEDSRQQLSQKVDGFLKNLSVQYQKRDLKTQPVAFVKNNAGTYGMGVTQVSSGEEILSWNSKMRKKMKSGKGGREIEELIIQEGVPSQVRSDGATAEPVVYMIGCEPAGAFLRTHNEKSDLESLNSPGAIYKKLCMADLKVDANGCPQENVYGWVAKLALLAIGKEAQSLGIDAVPINCKK